MAPAFQQQGRCSPSSWVQNPEFVCWRRGGEEGKERPAWLFSTLPFCSTAFHAVLGSVFPLLLCPTCLHFSVTYAVLFPPTPTFTSLNPQPTSLTSLPPWLNLPLLAFLPALAYGIGVKLRPLKLRPATQLPAGCRKEKRPHSNPTCNLWTVFQPPIPDWSSAFNEHLGLRTSAVQEA